MKVSKAVAYLKNTQESENLLSLIASLSNLGTLAEEEITLLAEEIKAKHNALTASDSELAQALRVAFYSVKSYKKFKKAAVTAIGDNDLATITTILHFVDDDASTLSYLLFLACSKNVDTAIIRELIMHLESRVDKETAIVDQQLRRIMLSADVSIKTALFLRMNTSAVGIRLKRSNKDLGIPYKSRTHFYYNICKFFCQTNHLVGLSYSEKKNAMIAFLQYRLSYDGIRPNTEFIKRVNFRKLAGYSQGDYSSDDVLRLWGLFKDDYENDDNFQCVMHDLVANESYDAYVKVVASESLRKEKTAFLYKLRDKKKIKFSKLAGLDNKKPFFRDHYRHFKMIGRVYSPNTISTASINGAWALACLHCDMQFVLISAFAMESLLRSDKKTTSWFCWEILSLLALGASLRETDGKGKYSLTLEQPKTAKLKHFLYEGNMAGQGSDDLENKLPISDFCLATAP
ncbi:MAG: hypothetical protein JXR42_01550 [Gammaproteobacteria bacterium]|nr:hypothetical protein [Gammaproteobacteria bacterium]